jgi:hypothetical protein
LYPRTETIRDAAVSARVARALARAASAQTSTVGQNIWQESFSAKKTVRHYEKWGLADSWEQWRMAIDPFNALGWTAQPRRKSPHRKHPNQKPAAQ